MLLAQVTALQGKTLCDDEVIQSLTRAFESQFTGKRVLILIPDHTRTLPLPLLFRTLVEALRDTKKLDFMAALGTHPALSDESINRLVGITAEERKTKYARVGLYNHAWADPTALARIGIIEQDQIKEIAGANWHPSLPEQVQITINKAVFEYDHIIIVGPTFPHEVVGFSGGAKYLFPGISGPEMINATHWLGALAGVVKTIGNKDTPVRSMIRIAAAKVTTPVTLIALVVEESGISSLFVGDEQTAWSAAADLSAQKHIRWCTSPYKLALSCAPGMYDELWTAAKAMYKLEPAIKVGGEVIIFAPHLETVSYVHESYIYQAGYHILPYFLEHWEQFKQIPLGVLAHCTHLRGSGVVENGVEKPNVRVTLASKISKEDCARLNLGYLDPARVKIDDYKNREREGILYVPRAGEMLYKLLPARIGG